MSGGSSPVSSVSIPLVATSLRRSARVGWGVSSVVPPPEARKRVTMWRSSSRVSTLSVRIVRAPSLNSGSHLVRDDVVHLAGELGAFAGQDRLRVQQPFVFPRLLDLDELTGQIPACLEQLAQEHGGRGRGERVEEVDEGPGAVVRGEAVQRPGNGRRQREQQGADREQTAVAGAFGEREQRGERGEHQVQHQGGGKGEQEDSQRETSAEGQGAAGEHGGGAPGGRLAETC